MKELKTFNQVWQDLKTSNDDAKETLQISDNIYELINKIILTRKAQKMSQKELAEKSGLKQPALARIESFKTLPSLTTLIKIAHSLNMVVDFVNDNQFILEPNVEIKIIKFSYSNKNGEDYIWNQKSKVCQY